MLYCLIEFSLLMKSALDGTSPRRGFLCTVLSLFLLRPNEFMKTYACSIDITPDYAVRVNSNKSGGERRPIECLLMDITLPKMIKPTSS